MVTDTDTTYQGGTNINIDIATTPDTINLDRDIRVDNIKVEVEIDLQGNDIIGGGTIYSQELNLGGNATIGGQLRVYNAGGGGTITDNFSGATGSLTGIISNLHTTFFTNGITGSQAPVQISGGAFFTPARLTRDKRCPQGVSGGVRLLASPGGRRGRVRVNRRALVQRMKRKLFMQNIRGTVAEGVDALPAARPKGVGRRAGWAARRGALLVGWAA